MTLANVQKAPLHTKVALSTVLFAIALLLRFVVLPVEAKLPFLTFYPATILAFLWFGPMAGAWCVLLSLVAGHYIFSTPHWSISIERDGALAAIFFVVSSVLIGMLAHRMNVTSRRLARQNEILGGDEERYRTILQDQTEVICRYRVDGTILYVNDAFCRMFGMSREQLVGHVWHPVAVSEDVPAIEASLRTLSTFNPAVTIENRVHAGDGTVRWGQFVNRAIFDDTGAVREIQAVGRDITERKRLEAEVAAMTRELEDLYQHAPCGYHSLDADGRFVRINDTELNWLGVTREEVIGKCTPLDFFTEEGRETFRRNFPIFKAQGHIEDLEFDLVGRHGKTRRVSAIATATRTEDGQFRTRSIFFDITESHELRRRLTELNNAQRVMLDNDLVGIVKLINRRSVWTNRALERMLGYGPGELLGTSARIIYPDDASFEKVGRDAYPVLNSGGTYRAEQELMRKDGSRFWVEMQGVLLSSESGESLWMFSDITALKERQQAAQYLATHDALTGLPNRRLLSEQLTRMSDQVRKEGTFVAACYIDLDNFKPLNDGYGHDTGDAVLKEIAARLRDATGTAGFPARFGGDEFVLLLPNLVRPSDYEPIVARVLERIAEPIAAGPSMSARLTASVGVAIFPLHAEQPQDLFRIADEAMFVAKGKGGGRSECFPLPEEYSRSSVDANQERRTPKGPRVLDHGA